MTVLSTSPYKENEWIFEREIYLTIFFLEYLRECSHDMFFNDGGVIEVGENHHDSLDNELFVMIGDIEDLIV